MCANLNLIGMFYPKANILSKLLKKATRNKLSINVFSPILLLPIAL